MRRTVSEFTEYQEILLCRFLNYWMENNAKNPESYQLEMADEEWNEQFISWRETL